MLEKCCDIYINIIRQFLVISACNWRAFVAQWLEHWSCKPGVESSNLSEGFYPNKVVLDLLRISETYKSFAQRGARTHDPQIKSLMLYRLS